MHFIMIKFVLICLYLMMPLRAKVILFCIFLKQYDVATEIYWHNNPTYLSLMGTALFKNFYHLLAKKILNMHGKIGLFHQNWHVKWEILWKTKFIWKFLFILLQYGTTERCLAMWITILFIISLDRNIRNTNLNFANISLKLWEKKNIENKLFY